MSEHLILTLGQIRARRPCLDGWRKLLTALGCDLPSPESTRSIMDFDGRFDPSRRVSLGDVAWSNGVSDALWCVGALPNTIEVRRAVVGMILPTEKRAAKRTTDARVHECVATVERWQAGDDTVDLAAAQAAAWAAETAAIAASSAAAAQAAAEAAQAALANWAAAAVRAAVAKAADAAAVAVAAAAEAAREAVIERGVMAWTTEAAEAGNDYPAERKRQRADIIAVSPPRAFAKEAANV